jgi:hypothetical protein
MMKRIMTLMAVAAFGLSMLPRAARADDEQDQLDRIARQLNGDFSEYEHEPDCSKITGWGKGFWPSHGHHDHWRKH